MKVMLVSVVEGRVEGGEKDSGSQRGAQNSEGLEQTQGEGCC